MQPGQTILHYRLAGKLGSGGMGEVWQASDTTLGRDVAIKLLPQAVASDPERLARFEREAKVLASLNHPNIAAIYGFHEDAGVRFLAMELVPGEDLAERLSRGALPIEEAVEVARQIAEALEAAHENGIVHRDLKPANVKLTPEGKVKVLDFGLAKALDPAGSSTRSQTDAALSPTVTSLGTVAGMILGTAAYMSPEQARGRAVDRRADIWAFGVILFELLAGRRLFDGETASDTLAAVLKTDPEWSALPSSTPSPVRGLLARCLERDPRQRLRDIGEARVLLSGRLEAEPSAVADATARTAERSRLPWILFGAAALAAVALAASSLVPRAVETKPLRKFSIDARLGPRANTRGFEISPDGTRIVYQSDQGIEVRELRETEPRLLVKISRDSTRDVGSTPFWSRDGTSIAYASADALMRVPAAGGSPAAICRLPGSWNGGTWMIDDTIAFATTRGPMYHVPARGGDAVVLVPLQAKEEFDFHQPSVLPDGRSLIYAVHRTSGVDTIEMFRDGRRGVVARLDAPHANILDSPQIVNNPFYAPTGQILFQRDQGTQGIWALPFSLERGAATGEPFLVAPDMGSPSVASDGTLVCSPLGGLSGQTILVARDGKLERALGEPQPDLEVGRFSPDGRRLLYLATERQARDIYVWDLATNAATRLTDTPVTEGEPVWIPGGSRIAFSAPAEKGCRSVFAMNADGTGAPAVLAQNASEPTFTPDGRELVYTTFCVERRGLDRMILGRPGVTPLLDAPAGIRSPVLSPDGRYLSYQSWASGKSEGYVTRYPSIDGRWLVTRSDSALRWSADGKELYYVEGSPLRMMAAPVQLDPVFTLGTPRVLFELAPLGVSDVGKFSFDVSPDGKRFAMLRIAGNPEKDHSIFVVENWFEEFRKR